MTVNEIIATAEEIDRLLDEWAENLRKLFRPLDEMAEIYGRLRKNKRLRRTFRQIRNPAKVHTAALGWCSYLEKARKNKRMARSTHTLRALHRGTAEAENDKKQCRHTFRITVPLCAPCGGYNAECPHYEAKPEEKADKPGK